MQSFSMDTSNTPSPSQLLPQVHVSSGSQIRSRVTVVCAECKRLKLKCDRRTPCSSCLKRDTVPRCTYSAAAAEKIDVQSLHNRVLVLEAQLNQLTSGKIKISSHELDRTLLAVGSSGSSVLVPLDDIAGIWLEHLDLARHSGLDLQPAHVTGPGESDLADKRGDFFRLNSPPRSIGGNSSPRPGSTASPFSSLNFPSHTAVTPALLSLLPPTQQRSALLDHLDAVLRMHPSLNFPHFRARVNAMFLDSNSPEEIGIGPQRTTYADKPTLSFFAAVAAGFALAMQCSPVTLASSPRVSHSSSSSPVPSTSQPTVTSLLSLSAHILDIAGDAMPYDLDYLQALILRCLCLLHDGQPRVNQVVFATVGKMVNIARLMGLSHDPDDFTSGAAGKYTLWEAEMRRRMWWDIFYYDLFISDAMGLPPLISDDQHTCRLPADVDEDAFVPKSTTLPLPPNHLGASNFSYFVQKCRLAQLVKNVKKRVSLEPSSSPSTSSAPQEPSIETATKAELDVQQFLSDLPPAFKLDIDSNPFDPTYTSSSNLPTTPVSDTPPAYLIIQRCELIAISHQLILKLFHPFLRRSGVRPSDSAMIASVNASHAIIHAAKVARCTWQRNSGSGRGMLSGLSYIPSSHGVFYPFGRQLFDAAVVAAHMVIQAPQSVVAKVALDDVRVALEILRDPAVITGRGRPATRGGVEDAPHEAVTIVEMLLKKAEIAKRNFTPALAGTKRKLDDIGPISKGFWLPYVSSGVATESAGTPSGVSSIGISSSTSASNPHGSPRAKLAEKASTDTQSQHTRTPSGSTVAPPTTANRAMDKERKYPQIGVRTRISASALSDHKSSPSSTLRRESSISTLSQGQQGQQKQQHTPTTASPAETNNVPDIFSRSGTSTVEDSSSMVTDPTPNPAGSYPMSNPYNNMEDNAMTGVNVSPTSRFPPPVSTHPPHDYSAAPFHSANAPVQQHQTMYNAASYSGEQSGQQSAPSFYVPYAPAAQSSQPEFSSMPGHSSTHSRSHNPQQSHSHLDMMNLMPQQHVMHTSEALQIPKQEEDTRQDGQTQNTSTQFTSEAWNNARYNHSPWGSGYSY